MHWWESWCQYHCAVFGWDISRHVQTLLVWRDLFARLGVTEEEMREATARAATSEKPLTWPAENLAALQSALRSLRRERIGKQVARDTGPANPATPQQIRDFARLMKSIGKEDEN